MPRFGLFLLSTSLLCGAVSALPVAAQSECKPDASCAEMKNCAPYETFRIDFERIRQCIEQGERPPKEWKRMLGRGGYSTGGKGSLSIGNLDKPFFPDMGTGGSPGANYGDGGEPTPPGGNPGGSGSSSGIPGPSQSEPPDCTSFVHPIDQEPCEVLGEKKPMGTQDPYGCGYSVQLDHEWAIFTQGATHAAMTVEGQHEMLIYQKSGANLAYVGSTSIPAFYCYLTDSVPPSVEKIPVQANQQFMEFSSNTNYLPVTMRYDNGTYGADLYDQYVKMTRSGTSFTAPPPNPEYFIAQGAINVDPECRSADQLFTEKVEHGFGDLLFGNYRHNSCGVGSVVPEDPSGMVQCTPFLQHFNDYNDAVIVPPGGKVSQGRIGGNNPYSSYTVVSAGGEFVPSATAGMVYNGPQLRVSSVDVYLSNPGGGVVEQAFMSGASFRLGESRLLRLFPPGRIKLDGTHNMQLIDGGEIEDSSGTIVRRIAPMGKIQFPGDTPIVGYLNGSIRLNPGIILPGNANNEMVLPYDSRLDFMCRREQS